MPKKHHTNYTKQAQALHNRPTSPKAQDGPGAGSSSTTTSVNQRLEQLRREQTPRATAEHRNAVSSVVSNPTLPPNVRHLLAIPETAPLKPKRGRIFQRGERVPDGVSRRAPAGPAAPMSWLHSSRHAPRNLRRVDENGQLPASTSSRGVRRARGRYNLSTMDRSLPDLPQPGSLMDTTMKSFARNWDWLVEYEQLNLATISVPLKATLLSYIALYGPDQGISIGSLRTLFLNDIELEGATGSKELGILDLSGLVGYPDSISLLEMHRYWISAPREHGTADLASTMQATTLKEPLESWEDEENSDSSSSSIPKAMNSHFPHLTVLSLSNPASTVSWAHLLSLSQHMATLTHLSLAHWPTPSLTPNAKTAVVESRHGNVSLGASNLYSALDDDWHEAASILRRFSNNTYRLRYLDLEGCNDWLPALVWSGEDEPSDHWATDRVRGAPSSPTTPHNGGDDAPAGLSEGPGWNTSWAQLTHINISQGWIPTDTAAVRALPSGSLQIQLLNYLRWRSTRTSENRKRERAISLLGRAVGADELQTYQVKRWLEKEKEARRIAGTIRAIRSSAGSKWIEFEYGWDANAVGFDANSQALDIAVEASRRAMIAAPDV